MDFHVIVTVFIVESLGFSGKLFFSLIIGYGRDEVPIIYCLSSTDVRRKARCLEVIGSLHLVSNVAVVVYIF